MAAGPHTWFQNVTQGQCCAFPSPLTCFTVGCMLIVVTQAGAVSAGQAAAAAAATAGAKAAG